MSDTLTYQQMGMTARNRAHALFAQTMGYVAVTAALFALGAWLGRDLTGGVGIVAFIAAFACLFGMRFAVRRSTQLTVGLLAAFGLLIGLGTGPAIAYYASADPQALWEAGGATALFIAGFGAAGYATRRDLAVVARVCFWALVALIVFGIVLIFVHIPGGELAYSVLGHVRLPAPAQHPAGGPGLRPLPGRVDLPGRAERLPVLPGDLLRLEPGLI